MGEVGAFFQSMAKIQTFGNTFRTLIINQEGIGTLAIAEALKLGLIKSVKRKSKKLQTFQVPEHQLMKG